VLVLVLVLVLVPVPVLVPVLVPGQEPVRGSVPEPEPAAFRPSDRQKRNRFHFRCLRKRQRRR
jgi:hypothetical protein